jgi:hypothetical protein
MTTLTAALASVKGIAEKRREGIKSVFSLQEHHQRIGGD